MVSERQSVAHAAPLERLGESPLTRLEFGQLTQSADWDSVEPLLENPRDDEVLAVSFTDGDEHYFVGWNPITEEWEVVLHLETVGDQLVVVESVEIYEGKSAQLGPTLGSEPLSGDVRSLLWTYFKTVYPETDHLWYIPDSVQRLRPR